jgi:hypothetical protein
MGILADIFVATPEVAASYDAMTLTPKFRKMPDRVEYGGLTGVELGKLWAILADKTWSVKTHMLETVTTYNGGEQWLLRFPTPFVELLAALPKNRVKQIATAWAETDELAGWGLSPVQKVLNDLVRLSKSASSSGRGLFLWGSL